MHPSVSIVLPSSDAETCRVPRRFVWQLHAFIVSFVSLLNASSGETLATTYARVVTDASRDIYKVLFDPPVMVRSCGQSVFPNYCVKIAPGNQYKFAAISNGPDSMFAENGRRQVTCHHGSSSATFTFTDAGPREQDEQDVSLRGHIPTIYFSFA